MFEHLEPDDDLLARESEAAKLGRLTLPCRSSTDSDVVNASGEFIPNISPFETAAWQEVVQNSLPLVTHPQCAE